MDARDLFAIIGRLYAANVELTEEGDRLRDQLKVAEVNSKMLIQENSELKMKCNDLREKIGRPVDCCEGVDARREEEQLKKDDFFD